LNLFTSSPNEQKAKETVNSANKRLNFDVNLLNSGPNTTLPKQCEHCELFGHVLKRHRDFLQNHKRLQIHKIFIKLFIISK
jgi:hypothetical protein